MKEVFRILAINPGSTSTKVAVFENDKKVFDLNLAHAAEDLALFQEIPEQKGYRRGMIVDALEAAGYSIGDMDAFVGRGGGMESCQSGTYPVGGILLEHAATCHAAKHPSVLGAVLSHEFAMATGKPAYIVNPPDVDELEDVARITGIRGVYRQSRYHVLNQKETGRRAAVALGKTYEESNLIVAHIGGGISIAAHRGGRVVDVNDIINGDGPMAPTRCGSVAVGSMLALLKKNSPEELKEMTSKNGGIVNLLGTSDMREVSARIAAGDEQAKLTYDAMIYQIGKSIGSCAAVLHGQVDGVVLTGGISYDAYVVDSLKKMVSFIAPVLVFPGENEMEALAAGALRVLRGEEELKTYSGKAIWQGFPWDREDQEQTAKNENH